MDHREAGRYWESNARTWTLLAREGWDVYRDAVNTPAFFELLPDVWGKSELDVAALGKAKAGLTPFDVPILHRTLAVST